MDPKQIQPLTPPRLKPGDKIALVAPASPFDRTRFEQGVRVLAQMGFVPHVPKGLFRKRRYLAGADAERAGMLNALFRDASVRAVVCARGGYGSIRLLPLLDYAAIAKDPKIFVGFSDATALLTAFFDRCGLICFHGPMAVTLAASTREALSAWKQALTAARKIRLAARDPAAIRPGKASGRVVGGNLTTLCHLAGTAFAPVLRDRLLILEDIGEPPYRVDRMLSHMRLAGSFDGLAGLVLGSFKNCGRKKAIFDIVADIFRQETFPISAGFDFGHIRNNLTIPIGLEATLDADRGRLWFHAAATEGK